MILPDSNIFVYASKGEQPYADLIQRLIIKDKLLISSIVAAEFMAGGTPTERKRLQALIDELGTLPIDTKTALQSARYRRQFRAEGYRLKLPDALIAATAKVHRADLVTNNLSHYPMTDIKILDKQAVLRWMKP
jgi:predicted nucleic acid-binding protein